MGFFLAITLFYLKIVEDNCIVWLDVVFEERANSSHQVFDKFTDTLDYPQIFLKNDSELT